MIRIENLRRLYGDFCAVDDVSFTIGQGEIVGLLGHNGAGKTTIMKMITGFLEPTSGLLEVNEKSLNDTPQEIQALIGYLPENLPVYPEMTVMDYLFYCANVRSIPKAEQNTAVKSAIEKTELKEKALAQIDTLSRGYKQRVGVAQALLHNPKLLILDEPTNGLDPHQTQKMRELILNLAEDATVILSTHIMQEVEAICDRVLILDSGKLAVDSSLEDLQRAETLLLETDANLELILSVCKEYDIDQSISSTEKNGHSSYLIKILSSTNVDELSNDLAKHIINSGQALYALNPQKQDLEQVFKNIQSKVEVSDAA